MLCHPQVNAGFSELMYYYPRYAKMDQLHSEITGKYMNQLVRAEVLTRVVTNPHYLRYGIQLSALETLFLVYEFMTDSFDQKKSFVQFAKTNLEQASS